MLSALLLSMTLSTPMAIEPAQPLPLADAPAAAVKEPDFAEKFFAFTLSPDASPQAKDSMVMSVLLGYLGCIVCAPAWAPVALTRDAQFNGDTLGTGVISYLVWWAISIVTAPLGIGLVILVVSPYATSIATLNAVDRDIRRRGLGGSQPKAPGSPPIPGAAPGSSESTPPPSYAY